MSAVAWVVLVISLLCLVICTVFMVWTVRFSTTHINNGMYELLARINEGIPVGVYVGDGRDLKVRLSLDSNNFAVVAAIAQQHFGEIPMGVPGAAQAPQQAVQPVQQFQPQFTQTPLQQPSMQQQDFNAVMNQLPSAGPGAPVQPQMTMPIPQEIWAMVQAAQQGQQLSMQDIPGRIVANENGVQSQDLQDSATSTSHSG
jgi:hypothetical protein